MMRLIIILFAVLLSQSVFANACVDGFAKSVRPTSDSTQWGTEVFFNYDLENQQYYLTWRHEGVEHRIEDPLHLKNCVPGKIAQSSNDYIMIRIGCGAPCWYATVIPLDDKRTIRKVWYPLDFDGEKRLLAYGDDNVITIDLETGEEKVVLVKPEACRAAFIGMCISEARFVGNTIEFGGSINFD